jgi:hypothetical protein
MKPILHGAFIWARMALNGRKRRFPARPGRCWSRATAARRPSQGSVALPRCAAAHPLHTRFASVNLFRVSLLLKRQMRPNPRRFTSAGRPAPPRATRREGDWTTGPPTSRHRGTAVAARPWPACRPPTSRSPARRCWRARHRTARQTAASIRAAVVRPPRSRPPASSRAPGATARLSGAPRAGSRRRRYGRRHQGRPRRRRRPRLPRRLHGVAGVGLQWLRGPAGRPQLPLCRRAA